MKTTTIKLVNNHTLICGAAVIGIITTGSIFLDLDHTNNVIATQTIPALSSQLTAPSNTLPEILTVPGKTPTVVHSTPNQPLLNQLYQPNNPLDTETIPSAQDEETTTNSWSIESSSEVNPSFDINEKVSEKEAITFDTRSVTESQVGDRVTFSLPGDQQYAVVVEKTQTHRNGDSSWQGHLEGYGNRYPATFTAGDKSGFATVTTPNGSYSLESVNGSGWVYKNPEEAELTQPGVEDYLNIGS